MPCLTYWYIQLHMHLLDIIQGVFLYECKPGYRKLWHSGGIVTFTSQLWLFPDMDAGVFVASNGPLTSRGSAALKVFFWFQKVKLGILRLRDKIIVP